MSKILSKQSQQEEKIKYVKKYKCPYCESRMPRTKLASHIEKYHEDMIPQGFTPNRVAFNTVNKKEKGTCIICKSESQWNEDKCRYDRLCKKKSCKDSYAKLAELNTGQHKKLKDPEYQSSVMLKNRSISGTYKFSDNGKVDYVGSYEKNFLEFMDSFFKIKSSDIHQPGPTIEYEYKGKKFSWITDYYYEPYNLVFDIKDGGDNPNTRPMLDYRAKQVAKEKAIAKNGKYNYIRATNNEFDQIFEIMAELRDLMTDQGYDKIVRIHEEMNVMMFTLPPQKSNNDVHIVNYLQKNTFNKEQKYALCKNYMSDIMVYNDGMFKNVSLDKFTEMAYDIRCFRFLEEANFIDTICNSKDDKDLYQNLTGKVFLDYNQIKFDSLFEEVTPFTDYLNTITECLCATAMESIDNKMVLESTSYSSFPSFVLSENVNDVNVCMDGNGIFVRSLSGLMRSKSYSDIDEIPKKIINFIKSC